MDIFTQSLELTRNRDHSLSFDVNDSAGDDAALNGVSGQFVIDGHDGAALVTKSSSAVAISTGSAIVTLDAADTASIPDGVYPFALILTDAQSKVSTAAEGHITFKTERL